MAKLDLREDFEQIYAYVSERVTSFDPNANDGPGDPGPVTRMELGFSFEQSGWVVLVFDTRPDAEPDGEWNGYIAGNELNRPRWVAACEANEDQTVTIIFHDGTERKLPPGRCEDFATVLGDLVKSVLLKARLDGVFATLPKAPRCELGVEEQTGHYGWPAYEDRGKENLV